MGGNWQVVKLRRKQKGKKTLTELLTKAGSIKQGSRCYSGSSLSQYHIELHCSSVLLLTLLAFVKGIARTSHLHLHTADFRRTSFTTLKMLQSLRLKEVIYRRFTTSVAFRYIKDCLKWKGEREFLKLTIKS